MLSVTAAAARSVSPTIQRLIVSLTPPDRSRAAHALVHLGEARGVPELGREVAVAFDALVDSLMSRPCAAMAASVKRSASAPYSSMSAERVHDVALRLRHLLPLLVAHEGVDVDVAERHLLHEVQPHHHHAGDPEEDDVEAYRFSVSWSRILPNGDGAVNSAGLDFYDRLVDALLENGIEPLVTLYHWDLPAALDDRGGWLNPDVADWFANYATVMFRRLDDRVKKWVTLNEPWVVSDGGYLHGALAPGHRNRFEAPIAAHNLLRAHGAAVQAYRAEGQHQIGLVVNLEPKYTASDDSADIAATGRADAYMNRQYLDPAILGSYPEEMAEIFGEAWPDWPAHDLDLIRQPIDFLGVNYYTRNVTRFDPDAWPLKARAVRQKQSTYTETGWEVFAPALTDTLLWVKRRYGEIPLYVTENGAAFFDPPVARQRRHQGCATRRLLARAYSSGARRYSAGCRRTRLHGLVAV